MAIFNDLIRTSQPSVTMQACAIENLLRDGQEQGFDLVLNATAASLTGGQLDLPTEILHSGSKAYDMSYSNEETPFCRWARGHGIGHSDGLGMLVGQAAESFYLWRGLRPDPLPVYNLLKR